MLKRTIFTVGGTVQAGGGRYLPRQVDDELLAHCRAGTFAFVLSARQMGKSSLMVRTAQRLAETGTRSVIVDLTQIGVQVTSEAWYFGLLTTIEDALDLETDTYAWWKVHNHLSFSQRLTQFFHEVLLDEIREPVVIFLDEIDTTLSLPFTDDFFAAVRYVYNARSHVPAFKRLSFVLIGVATPIDLISDSKRTPFNIGHEVDVDYFTPQEAMPLADGFEFPREEARHVLRWILKWTGGHPYLTQRLCALVADRYTGGVTEEDVDHTVADTLLGERREQDSNLRFVSDMLTRRALDPLAVLNTYRQIALGRRILDDTTSPILSHLKLSGVVGPRDGKLVIRNRIYATVFDSAWVKEQWPEAWYKRIPPAVIGLAAALFAALILFGLFLLQTERARQARERSTIQAGLNDQLSDQIRVADSLRNAEEAINIQLFDQIRVADSLRNAEEAINRQLSEQIRIGDSLRAVEETVNTQFSDQIRIADSLRQIAELRLDETRKARLETLTIALASKALRQVKLGNAELGALLARQAFFFSQAGEGEFLDPVYDALRETLNALHEGGTLAAGPYTVATHQAGVRAVAYSPHGRWIASSSEDGTILLWSTETRTTKRLAGHTAGVRSLAFSPEGTLLASGSDDHSIRLWRTLTTPTADAETLGQHQAGVWTLAFAPTGNHLASAGADGRLRIWDIEEQTTVAALTPRTGVRVMTLAFSPDGDLLAIGCEDGSLHVWPWRQAGNELFTMNPEQGRLLALAFSPNDHLLVSGGDRPVIQVWRVDPPRTRLVHVRALQGHEGPINALAFSPNGETFASGSSDHSIQVWRVQQLDRQPIILQAHSSWVWSLAFSPDGEQLASGGADRTLRLWNISPQRLAEEVCTAVNGRELSREEWDLFVGLDYTFAQDYVSCASRAEITSPSQPFNHVSPEEHE